MTLPYDYARCTGYDNPICEGCRRREPGRERYQSYVKVPNPVGKCSYKISTDEESLAVGVADEGRVDYWVDYWLEQADKAAEYCVIGDSESSTP